MKRLAGAVKRGILLDRPVDDDPRCQRCDGGCCRAFPSVELSFSEYERLLALGAQRLERVAPGRCRLNIEYGCEFLVDGKCSIYPHRPAICRRFTCRDE
jgi:Fe-S-cluster containining protein